MTPVTTSYDRSTPRTRTESITVTTEPWLTWSRAGLPWRAG